jgi:hypothetical protein
VEDVHIERLSKPIGIGRPIKKRTAVEIGVDERYSVGGDGLWLGLGGQWVEGSLEAKQGDKRDVNHERQECGEELREFKSGEGAQSRSQILRDDALYSHISTHSVFEKACLEVYVQFEESTGRFPDFPHS